MNSIFIADDVRFGLSLNNGSIQFFAPKFLLDGIEKFDKFEEIELLKKYMYILKSYANSKSDNILYFRENNKSESFDMIEAYLNIIHDHILNGDFVLFSNINNISQKKINWSKTIRNNDIILQNNNVMYGSFTSQDKKINRDDIFMNIYSNILDDASCMFLNAPTLKEKSIISNNQAIFHINKYLDTHFKDREIFIAKQLKKIFMSRNFSSVNENSFDVKYHENFEHIFQFLVEKNISAYSLPHEKRSGLYINTIHKNNITSGLSLRLDHFIKLNNNYFILDSKYYLDYITNDKLSSMPKTGDIIKQVGYKLYISEIKKIPIKNICSVFIFPCASGEFEHFANHIVENDSLSYFSIVCIKLNILYYVKCISH